jgi:hypothetical protein
MSCRNRWFGTLGMAGLCWFVLAACSSKSITLAAGEASMKVVRYEDFGAVGDGETDDQEAIARAHAHANANGLPVEAKDEATYYIGGGNTRSSSRRTRTSGSEVHHR